ncbi:MAG: hypothetical protein ACHQFX_18830 [Chitinophagales bacterium]
MKQKIEAAFDNINVHVIARSSRGDALQDVPLHTVEGSDFFTQDIFDSLANNEADIAVHSLKDMSSEHFFGANKFAVVDRDDVRDVVILSQNASVKSERGENLVIGTCSPRREEMAIGFLQKALPRVNKNFRIETKSIRGNIDTRLRKLDSGEYDGIILATAGLNRLLTPSAVSNPDGGHSINNLLKDKKLILLPLIECAPAPCQGAIVAEANASNQKAMEVLAAINDGKLTDACIQEKHIAKQYGVGCLQRFGVTTIRYGNKEVIYAAGRDNEGTVFTTWTGLPGINMTDKNLFSATDLMGSFFTYDYNGERSDIQEQVVYVANYKAVEQKEVIEQLKGKRVWAAGTKTWFELAKKGIHVEGCADAFGLEFLQTAWQMPLFNISKKDIAVVTSNEAAEIWRSKGWNVYGTYSAKEKHAQEIEQRVKHADVLFWTSFRQYVQYQHAVKKDVIHVCSYGETAEQFKAAGISPVIFPNIKAFQQWKQTSIRSHSVA